MKAATPWTQDEVAEARARGDAARVEFDTTLAELRSQLAALDPIEVLARVAFSMFLRIAGLAADPSRKGVEVFHVELLQALVLTAPRCPPRVDDDYSSVTQSSIELIERNGQAYRRRWLGKLGTDAAHNQREELIGLLQTWTMAIRGPRHAYQTAAFLEAMAVALGQTFHQRFACRPRDVITMLDGVIKAIEIRTQEHLEWLRSWIRKSSGIAMIDAFVRDLTPEEAASIRREALPYRYDRKALRGYFLNLAEDRFAPLFIFTAEELLQGLPVAERASLSELLDSLSLGFRDIDAVTLEHLHLSNPVRLKPLVRLGDGRYFCCNPHSLGTNLAEVFEEICGRHSATKKRLEKARADWLEVRLRALLKQYLPHAEVHRSVKWTDPTDGRGYESDAIALIDKTLLIFEAKSGKIGPAARRGALHSLKGALKELVIDPSDQSRRFQRLVETATGLLHLKSADGELVIDQANLRNVIRVNVLLDVIGPLSAHWPQLKAAGLVPVDADIAPTMSVFELETVFEVLTLEVERCHYLSRRVIFERDVTYVADELDLLAFYLETQFNLAAGDETLWLYGRSLNIALGYSRRRADSDLSFPIKRTALWARLLAQVEAFRPVGWTRFGHRLLNLDLEGQLTFERLVREGQRKVARSPSHFFTSAVTQGEGSNRHTIAFAIGSPDGPEEFNDNLQYAANSAFEQSGVPDLLMLYWHSPPSGAAYDFIGVLKQEQLTV